MAATVWKGHLSFGLISIPVRLYRAARAERVSLRELYRPGREEPRPEHRADVIEIPHREPVPAEAERVPGEEAIREEPPTVEPIRRAPVPMSGVEPVAREDVVKGYEYAPGEWAVVDRQELRRMAAPTSKTMDIREFVRFSEVDPLYLETSYFVVPDRNGEKAYALLFQALRETGYAGVAEVAMHSREHVVILRAGRAGIVAHTMFYENEIRREQEYHTDVRSITARELELARLFVESLAAPFQPEKYRDRYRERLEQLIAAKVEGREVAAAAPPEPTPRQVDELISALERSLAAVKKPPASIPKKKTDKKRKHR